MTKTDTAALRERVADKANGNGGAVERKADDSQPKLIDLINAQRSEIARALPKHMDADRLARIASTVVRTTPQLLECSTASVLGALMLSAQTGLEPGPLGHAYFVPRWNGKTKTQECQWQIGYKGIVELARRSGKLVSIEAREVCERDEFTFEYGLDERLVHRPYMGGDRGPIVAFWGLAKFTDGGHYFLVMSRADVDEAMQRSDAGKKGFGPWVTDYPAMGRKTVIRRMAPFLPLSPEQANVLTHDEQVNTRVHVRPFDEPAEVAWIDVPVTDEPPALPVTVPPENMADFGLDRDGKPLTRDYPADVDTSTGEVLDTTAAEPEPEPPAEHDAEPPAFVWTRPDGALPPPGNDPAAERRTDAQSKAVHALLRNRFDAVGPQRFPVLSAILGREVTTSADISKAEAGYLIDVLQEDGAGADSDGAFA